MSRCLAKESVFSKRIDLWQRRFLLSLATQANPTVQTPSTREGQAGRSSGRSQSTTCTSKRPAVPVKSATIEEHRRLFGYKPTSPTALASSGTSSFLRSLPLCRFVPKETTVLLTFNRNSRPFGGTRGRLRPT